MPAGIDGPSDQENAQPKVLMLALNDLTHDSRVRREAHALAEAGYAVHVTGSHDASSPLPDQEQVGGWSLARFRYRPGVQALRRLPALASLRHAWQAIALIHHLRNQEAAIRHAHDFPALVLLWLARLGQRNPGPLVYDTHELYFHRAAPPRRPWNRLQRWLGINLERWLACRADLILTTSPYFAQFLARQWHIPPPTVILNGATAPVDHPALPRPAGARLWLVHTGHLIARGRRLPDLLGGLASSPDDVHLSFIGGGPQEGDLRALARALNLSRRVHFVPPVPPAMVSAAIREADAAVIAFDSSSPGYALTLPNKLFEAIAAGLPVLGAETPALSDFFAEHPVGLLWRPGDPADLARAIARLREPAARRQWQRAARQAQLRVGWPAQASRLVASYRQIALTSR